MLDIIHKILDTIGVEQIQDTDMNKNALINFLVVMGIRASEGLLIVEDYLEEELNPSFQGLLEYKNSIDSENASQIRWNAQCSSSPVSSGKSLDGEGFAAYMNNLPRMA